MKNPTPQPGDEEDENYDPDETTPQDLLDETEDTILIEEIVSEFCDD